MGPGEGQRAQEVIIACPDCGAAMEWSLDRVGNQPLLITKCRHCNPGGPWHHEQVEIVRGPRGKPLLLPAPTDAPFAPVDDPQSEI